MFDVLRLRRLRNGLEARKERLVRAARLTSVTVGPIKDHKFEMEAEWPSGRHSKVYDLSSVSDSCRALREFAQEILQKRGI